MSSVPTSQPSPTHRRRSVRLSSFDVPHDSTPSPYTSGTTNGTAYSRRSSRTSQTSFMHSPVTPRPSSARSSRPSSLYHRRKSSSRLSIGSNISIGANELGLGNLADELEDALDAEYEVNETDFLDGCRDDGEEFEGASLQSPHNRHNRGQDSPLASPQSPTSTHQSLQPVLHSPTKLRSEKRRQRHQRIESRYDGSDYGPESDQDEDGISPALAKRLRDVESLARMGFSTEDMLGEGGGVVKRTAQALKDLGPQAGIEMNLSRVIAAYTSMATHRTHKTRDFLSQTHSFLYGNAFNLPEDTIDTLLSDLDTLSSTTTLVQQPDPLLSLQMLASQTLDLAQTLRSLTDVLQESRIQANTTTRKLKSVKDMVEDICTEQELTETSMLLIQAGDWDRRCRERQAAATCREVVLGFGDRWGMEVDDRPWTREREAMVS